MALIDSKKVQINGIPIVLFSSVFDGVFQEFADCFQDFEKISEATRLVFLFLVETESAPLNLQIEQVELKNNEQLVKKFNDQENLLAT